MCTGRVFLTTTCLVILGLGGFCSSALAQADFSLSLGSGVVADPGQRIPLSVILSSSDSVAGLDMLVEFDPVLLANSTAQALTRFQYFSYDNSAPGKLRITARRRHSDSSFISPLAPGLDTLGLIWVTITSEDLLTDVQTPVLFYEDPVTPFADNRLVGSDSSFVTPPELVLADGGVFIRHPIYGDVNDDGYEYTIADAIFFFNFLAGSQRFDSRQKANSDVNRDGVQASMTDFIQLIKIIAE
jgi:hypothetical protein